MAGFHSALAETDCCGHVYPLVAPAVPRTGMPQEPWSPRAAIVGRAVRAFRAFAVAWAVSSLL